MSLYVALDVSQKETHICVVDEHKKVVWEGKCFTSPTAIADKLNLHVPHPTIVGLETGALSTWLYHELKALGVPVVVMDARDANARMGKRVNKNDRNDARGLAELLRAQMHKEVQVKSYDNHRTRGCMGARGQLVRTVVDLQNQIRGLLKVEGTVLTRCQLKKLKESVPSRQFEQESIRALSRVVAFARKEIQELDKSLKRQSAQRPEVKRLMSIPGIGPITALTFVSTIDDPTRFRKSRTVGAYLGLTPTTYQSGTIDIVGRISKHGDRLLRGYLYEAAGVLLMRKSSTSPIQEWAHRVKARVGHKKACVALARKLAVIMHRILITGEEYRPEAAAAVPAAA